MMQITATIVQDSETEWTAVTHIGEDLVIGDGKTREEAIASLTSGIRGLFEYMRSAGEPLPEMVTFDVAA